MTLLLKETEEGSCDSGSGGQPDYGSIPLVRRPGNNSTDAPGDRQRNFNNKLSKPFLFSVATAFVFVLALAIALDGGTSSSDNPAMISPNSLLVPQDPPRSSSKSHHGPFTSSLYNDDLDERELFFHMQWVDHVHAFDNRTFTQRYYKKSAHFKGPGHPILVILGGEDALKAPIIFPFVKDGIAQEFGAFTLSIEHRFYGKSHPTGKNFTLDDMVRLLTPDQAMLDYLNLILYVREELRCSLDRSSDKYCPVITFGGSYPGFLSFAMRFLFNDYIDIAYASSAPLLLYSQKVDTHTYYEKVSETAAIVDARCPLAIRQTLESIVQELRENFNNSDVQAAARHIGICADSDYHLMRVGDKMKYMGKLPDYMTDVETLISEAIVYLVPAIFADYNMAFYPPGPQTAMGKACLNFMDSKSPSEKMAAFFRDRATIEYSVVSPDCFDLHLELPAGNNARIMGADWSGTGGGRTGELWEFQCCQDLIIRAGYSNATMFLPREWTYAWHQQWCKKRFPQVFVEPFRMVNQWGFDDLTHADKILFTNGLNDGWSTCSILEVPKGISPNIKIVNFPNGAHHSDLSYEYPNPRDTDDIKEGYTIVLSILRNWLNDIKRGK